MSTTQQGMNMSDQELIIQPMSSTIGAEIHGIDLRERLSNSHQSQLRNALLAWKVIFFRDQPITVEQHLEFARRFGELEIHPFVAHHEEHQEVLSIAHGEERPGGENIWHSDVTWREEPSLGSILHLRKVPPVGGDTLFADMGAAYRGLPDDIKQRVTGLEAVHDFNAFKTAMRNRGVTQEKIDALDRQFPNPTHPVIRTHPETGEQSIYVNRAFTREVVGLPAAESQELLEILYRQANHPEYQCRFTWRNHSIAFWDNRACQHYAVSDYWPHQRIAERVTIVGDKPYFQAGSEKGDELDAQFAGVIRRLATGEKSRGVQLGHRQ